MRLEFESLDQNGFVKFSCNSFDENTLEIAQTIGCVASLPGIAIVQTLRPCGIETKQKNSYSGNFGMGEFPLHTDMAHWYVPPRFFVLRCVQAAQEVHTNFVPAREIIGSEDHITLKRALFRPRRRLDKRLTVLRLFDNNVFRWDTLFIQPVNNIAVMLQTRIAKCIAGSNIRTVTFESPTDCILVDNWRALHGRSTVAATDSHRIVERVYLSTLKEHHHAEN